MKLPRPLLFFLMAGGLTTACGGEIRERRDAVRPVTAAAPSSPAPPLPDTAFRSDRPEEEADTTAPPPKSRFETRRIAQADDSARAVRYTGRPITLDLKNTDLQEAFRLIADVGKVNVVVSGEVSGTITLKLTNVPWDQALDVIARTKDLAVERDGNIFLVHARAK